MARVVKAFKECRLERFPKLTGELWIVFLEISREAWMEKLRKLSDEGPRDEKGTLQRHIDPVELREQANNVMDAGSYVFRRSN